MIKKIGKFRLIISVFGLVTLSTLILVGQLAAKTNLRPVTTYAQNSQNPEPRVLQAGTCKADPVLKLTGGSYTVYTDSLKLTPGSTSVKQGEQLKISYALDPACLSKLEGNTNFKLILRHGPWDQNEAEAFSFLVRNNQPTSGSVDFVIDPSQFSVGQHQLVLLLSFSSFIEADGTVARYYLMGTTIFDVQAADTTGNASLSSTFVSSGKFGDKSSYKYYTTYNKGGSGIDADKVIYDCDGDGTEFSEQSATPGATIECLYNPAPKTYTITFRAQAGGADIPGATTTAIVNVTGAESNTGSQAVSSSDATCLGLFDTPVCVINLVLGVVGNTIQAIIRIAFVAFVGPMIEALVSVHTYEDNFANVVFSGWVILRNLANILFILAIVAMGIATVFRISGYAVRDMMVKLIIGAFLVNFSLVIPQAILGIAETVQNQFLAPGSGAIRAIANPLFTTDLFENSFQKFGSIDQTVKIFLNLWVSIFAFVMFVGLMFLLMVRMVILWLLLMTSPLPYAAMIFPATRNLSKIWWTWLLKWAFMTPVIAFMLNLTAVIVKNNSANLRTLITVDPSIWNQGVELLFTFANLAIPIVFLFATLRAASFMASGASTGIVDKGLGMVGNLAGIGAGSVLGYAVAKPAVWAGDRLTREPRQKAIVKLRNIQSEYAQKWFGASSADIPDKGSLKNRAKRFAYNVLAGDRLYAEKKQDWDWEKAQAVKKLESGGRAHLEVLSDRSPDYIFAQQEAEERAEEEGKRRKQLEGLSQKDRINKLLESLKSKTGKLLEADMDIIVKDAIENKYLGDLQKAITKDADLNSVTWINPATGLREGVESKEITDLYRIYYDRLRAGEGQKDSQQRLSRLQKLVNSQSIPSGKLHLVVDDETNFEDPSFQNTAANKRRFIMSKKGPEDLAGVSPETFINPSTQTVNRASLSELAQLVTEFRNPAAVSDLSNQMTSETKRYYKAALNGPNGPREIARIKRRMITMNGRSPDFTYTDVSTGRVESKNVNEVFDQFMSSL